MDYLTLRDDWTFESRVMQNSRIHKRIFQEIFSWPNEDPIGFLLERYEVDNSPAILYSRNYRNRGEFYIFLYVDHPVVVNFNGGKERMI